MKPWVIGHDELYEAMQASRVENDISRLKGRMLKMPSMLR